MLIKEVDWIENLIKQSVHKIMSVCNKFCGLEVSMYMLYMIDIYTSIDSEPHKLVYLSIIPFCGSSLKS